MGRSIARPHVEYETDGTFVAYWAPFALRTALQPIFAFDGPDLRQVAFEGLVRPTREADAISPATFFHAVPAVERLRIEALTRDLHILNAGAVIDGDASIYINFDPSLFCDRIIVQSALRQMRGVVEEAGLVPARIVCEVTEQCSRSASALRDFVDALRADGYRVAVDDYGAESSDIERVKELRPDIVKFDARWIVRLMKSRPGVALLSVMVREFRNQGILAVFEGIEEQWQIEVAAEVGVPMVQGFALAHPRLVSDIRALSPSVPASEPGRDEAGTPDTSSARAALASAARTRGRVFGKRRR